MTKTEYLEQICTNLGIDVSKFPDRLITTYLSAISEVVGVMKDSGTLDEFLSIYIGKNQEAFNSGYSEGSAAGYTQGYNKCTEDMDENLQAKYNAGYAAGNAEGLTQGIERGKEAERSNFWDAVQNHGNRTNYEYAFFGETWNDNTFHPKYDMVLGEGYTSTSMFRTSIVTNLKQRLEDCGVVLDTSRCQAFNTMFYNSQIVVLPTIDMSNAEYGTDGCFTGSSLLTTIEKIIFSEKTLIQRMFVGCGELQNVIFEGVIAQNGLDLKDSKKLSRNSLVSIMNCLQDKNADTSGTVWKITIGSTNLSKLTDEELDIAYQKGWYIE